MKTGRIANLEVRVESSPPGANVYAPETRILLEKTPLQMSVGYVERQVGPTGSTYCYGNIGGIFTWSLGEDRYSGGAQTNIAWRACPPNQYYLAINPPYSVYFRIEADGYLPVDEKVSFTHFETRRRLSM
jgi:hypothetical protein